MSLLDSWRICKNNSHDFYANFWFIIVKILLFFNLWGYLIFKTNLNLLGDFALAIPSVFIIFFIHIVFYLIFSDDFRKDFL